MRTWAMATKRPCEVCRRQVNPDRPGADHLFNRPDGSEVWLCGRPKCLTDYNEEPDVCSHPRRPEDQLCADCPRRTA